MKTQNKKLSLAEILQRKKAIREEEKALKEKIKNEKRVIFSDLEDTFSAEEKDREIKRAEALLENAKVRQEKAKEEFRNVLAKINLEVQEANDILELVGYKQTALGKRSSLNVQVNVETKAFSFVRDGKTFSGSFAVSEWQKILKQELIAAGLEDGQARNVCYKVKLAKDANFAEAK